MGAKADFPSAATPLADRFRFRSTCRNQFREEGYLANERAERRLTAILAADIAGYSRLMGADEEGTLAQLKACRRELVDPKIVGHRGRIVKTTGDGMLVEFRSIVEAVVCAVEVQRGMFDRNATAPEDRRIVFRIGINVGDILIDGDDIFGDGVNVAARLEALCEPGGVCISRAANEQVRDKLPLAFVRLLRRAIGARFRAHLRPTRLGRRRARHAQLGAADSRGSVFHSRSSPRSRKVRRPLGQSRPRRAARE